MLQGGHRADPSVYKGIYSQTGKLLCVKADMQTTACTVKLKSQESLASDHAHASTLTERMSSPSFYPIPAADDQQISNSEGEVGKAIVDSSGANLTAKDTILLDLLSSLF